MNERRTAATTGRAGQEAVRLRLFAAVDDVLGDAELLPFVLSQAVADVGGLGGMVHRTGGEEGVLRLAAAAGLPREVAKAWEEIGREERVAPAEAVRTRGFVWSPLPGSDAPGAGGRSFPAGEGLASVPLPGPDGPLGALTVLTTSAAVPDREQQAFLAELAGRAGRRLTGERAQNGVLSPAWWQVSSGAHLEEAMRAISVGIWVWDLRTGRLRADEPALRAVGLEPETFDERIESWSVLVHPDDVAGVFAEIDRSVAEHGAYSLEYRVVRPDGRIAWIEARGYVTYDEDGRADRMTGTLWETTDTRMARDAVDRALRHMSDGFLALDDGWRILYCNAQAERVLGGHGLMGRPLFSAVPDASAFRLPGRYRQAVDEGRPVGCDVLSPASRRSYHMRLPVPGGLTVYFTDVTELRAAEAERARAAQVAATRSARIGALTEALAQALTADEMSRAVGERLLSLFGATGLLMGAVEDDRLRVLGSVGYPEPFIAYLNSQGLSDPGPVREVLNDRVPKFVTGSREFARLYPGSERPDPPTKNAWAFLPLIASGRPVGYCVISFDEEVTLPEEDRALLIALSGLIAHAFERARLYDAEHSRAQELQRGMLPRTLPVLPALTPAARYLPAGVGMEVGGDWYDVIPLSAERVALVIGDVMGHGLPEAVTMGRLRTAVHTLSDLDIPPDEVLSRLNSLVTDLGDDFYATCLYGVYDPTTRRLTFSSAGHPPPAVLDTDGSVRFPAVDVDPPLGVAGPPFASAELEIAPDSVLVFYTDGLVESAERDMESGMARLAKILTAALNEPPGGPGAPSAGRGEEAGWLGHLCDTLTAELLPGGDAAGDDAALLVARVHAMGARDIAVCPLPEDPVAARQARRWVRELLDGWGLDELAGTTQALVSELIGNVVRHAKGPLQLRLLRGRTLTCEVYDGSLTTPRIRHAADTDEGGRGLQLVAALSHRWGARYTPAGKCIWTEQLLPAVDAEPGADAA